MTIDTSEPTINALYQWNPDLFTIVQKKVLWLFYREVTAFYGAPIIPLFSIMQLQEKHWDTPTSYAWRNYWTVL